jgi:acetyl/propionyl-CoA carboxylase alpha subunit/acetyl-CoA carboxylase carboxyltransferase component
MSGLLIANRGEVALRLLRAASSRGLRAVVVHSEDDRECAHVREAKESVSLPGVGPAAYLDVERVVDAAVDAGCHLLHPGYGFLSESAALARRCAERGVGFVGPSAEILDLFADKTATRRLADSAGIAVLAATPGAVDDDQARAFLDGLGQGAVVMVKALVGGGGRGMRVVHQPGQLAGALARCRSEAARAFGSDDVYVERYLPRARHVEVQVLGDGRDATHLWDRECSIQRRHQKVLEVAPAFAVPRATREQMWSASLQLARQVGFSGLVTFEFLVDVDDVGAFYFMEANPRLQVEHGITEQITAVDLVDAQLGVAEGRSLAELGLVQSAIQEPRGIAMEARVTFSDDVDVDAVLLRFEPPSGRGVRVETHGYPGLRAASRFDPLIAKVIVHDESGEAGTATAALSQAVGAFVIEGAGTNLELLVEILSSTEVGTGDITTSWLDDRLAASEDTTLSPAGDGEVRLVAHVAGTVIGVAAPPGTAVRRGEPVLVLEAMKMEHEVTAPVAGTVRQVLVGLGEMVHGGTEVAVLAGSEGVTVDALDDDRTAALDHVRDDLADLHRRRDVGQDENRSDAVAKRHALGKRTARENVADLCADGTFLEYGGLVIAAQRTRRTVEDLERSTPADGLVAGFGRLKGPHGPTIGVLAYDYTVLAGTQGLQNHKKAERLFEVARRRGTPVVVFAEGGGGRPGDVDNLAKATGMDLGTFVALGRLNGVVPTVAIASGRCFAGNAAIVGACDVVIATVDANIGMGGPAMIEGGGLGRHASEDIGPIDVQTRNGVVDVAVADEVEAVEVARRYLGYFSGRSASWECADQRRLRHVVPEARHRVYDVRELIDVLCDVNSVLELRPHFGRSVVTVLGRIEGMPIGLVANDGAVLGGAIDGDSADKMARFLQLCDAHGIPLVTVCDTPGFMVGPESETTATVRHFGRLFVTAPNLSVPLCTVIVRKAYGLGGQAMAGGSFRVPDAITAWPTGEFGAMGPEGAVRLGFRRELEEIDDEAEAQLRYEELLEEYKSLGRATNAASVFEIDDVIDPATTRAWIIGTLETFDPSARNPPGRRIDTW